MYCTNQLLSSVWNSMHSLLAHRSESKIKGKQQPRRPSKPTNATSISEATPVTKGSMFSQSTQQQPSHFTIHPQWASEAIDHSKKLK